MLSLGELLDRCIEPFAPRWARTRLAERSALQLQRDYDAAGHGRRTRGWRRSNGSADREIRQGLRGARNGARELVRNTKYAANALEHMVAATIGDGISARAVHSDPAVQRRAQESWDNWANSPVDGWQDFYGAQELVFRGTAEGGEMLIVWSPDDTGPDGEIRVLEGDYLDDTKNIDHRDGSRIVQGVEFDTRGRRVAYWIFPHHPGDASGLWAPSVRYDAAHVDHVYVQKRAGQTRGISWFAPVAVDLRDIADLEQSRLLKEKITACLALVLSPPDGSGPTGPFEEANAASAPPKEERGPDTLRPGMIFRARPGERAETVNPPAAGDTTSFIKQQVAAATASLAPYHLVTGDVSQANYTSQRAARLGELQLLDSRQQHLMIPRMCQRAWDRRMRRLFAETGDRRFLEVKAAWSPPVRRVVDPVKDTAGEKMEIRAGLKSMPQALAERGRNWPDHIAEVQSWTKATDEAGLVFDTDARRIDGSGGLQPPAGYIAPRGQTADETEE